MTDNPTIMTRQLIQPIVFLAGLAVACWIGIGYAGSNALALAVTLLIVGFYVGGALELRRYHAATSTLSAAIAGLSEPPASLGAWLDRLHPSLRDAVRLRIEGERVALPGPALSPYLIGLLVLLGMLGTFLGMVATLRGTGIALESATDLHAIRASLAAPVKGLGFAFGTSVAGVATSAMLGLLSALCRQERIQAAQGLDARIATTLRPFSRAHQREEAFRLLQRQAEVMPALADRLQAMMSTMEKQSEALAERLATGQDAFHDKTQAVYTRLAASVEQSLKASVADSAQAAGAAIQPAVEATMASLARETAAVRDAVTDGVQRHLDSLSTRFETTAAGVAHAWGQALAEQQRTSEALAHDLRTSCDGFAETLDRRAAGLLENVATHLDTATASTSEAWRNALSRHESASGKLANDNQQALTAAVAALEQHAASLVHTVHQSHADTQAMLASRDEARLAAWTTTLGAMATGLREEWAQTSARAASRYEEIGETLARTAREISSEAHAHTQGTIAEVGRLMQAATEAPKAAAEVIAELRQKLSDDLARDNAVLEERNRLLETLETLLCAVNHASSGQRTAIDTLISTTAELLDRVGARFADRVESESGKLAAVAAQVTGGAVEVASLGEAFGVAVQLFRESNDKLMDHLQRIETALDKSMTRSDEQLAYYVAQAREVVDLSMVSQKQILEDLQRHTGQQAPSAEAA